MAVVPIATEVGPEITGVGKGLIITIAFPVIFIVQDVARSVATTVYVPAAVCRPKLREDPVPVSVFTRLAPLYRA